MSQPPSGSPSGEVDRLRRVYRSYDADEAVRRRWSHENRGNRAIAEQRAQRAIAALQATGRWPTDDRRTLDLGCGTGGVVADLFGAVSSPLTGVDLSAERLTAASGRLPAVGFVQGDGSLLPFPSATFDLVLAFTVFSSLRDHDFAGAVAAEVDRVLRPGGAVLWYDMRRPNPGNPHTRSMSDRAVRALFPGYVVDLAPVTLLPPVARHLGRATAKRYAVLSRIGPLNTHALGLLSKTA